MPEGPRRGDPEAATWTIVATAEPGVWEDAQAYPDKLDGKTSEDFWMRKSGKWRAEENHSGCRRPFDLICQNIETEKSCALGGDFRTIVLELHVMGLG